ncbi:hypothetical protein DFH94DRAFT_725646 [Russula ochroleuca]|uniref:Uncharacterized protein n=1 Tax=Russula ochroleuca TaxID=152965 RepID=A0A9P5N1H5_9AGAM|nr:hypothetical protein DFH94DRAFT_725646 [Russula ochroleuca]
MHPLDGNLEVYFCFGSRHYSLSYSWDQGLSLYSVSLNRVTDAAEMHTTIHSNPDTSLANPLRASRLLPIKVFFPTEGLGATIPGSKIDSLQVLAPFIHLVHADPYGPVPNLPNFRRRTNTQALCDHPHHQRQDHCCLPLIARPLPRPSPTPAWRPRGSPPQEKNLRSGLELALVASVSNPRGDLMAPLPLVRHAE